MHLLFLSSLLPDGRPSTGFEIANHAIAQSYRRQGVRLSFAGFRRPGRLRCALYMALHHGCQAGDRRQIAVS